MCGGLCLGGVFGVDFGKFANNPVPGRKNVSPFYVEKGGHFFFCQRSSEKHATLQYKYYIGDRALGIQEFAKKKACRPFFLKKCCKAQISGKMGCKNGSKKG